MDNTELQHDGIKGMKWGLRRFQYKDGSLTPEGRKRYAKNKKSDDDKKKETPKPKTKEEVLKSGSAKELMEFKGEITEKEYADAFKRLENEKKLSTYSEAEVKTALDKFSDIMGKVDQVRVGTQKAIDAYNTIAKVNNAFNPSFRLPEINSGSINRRLQRAENDRDKARDEAREAVREADKARRLDNIESEFDKKGAEALKGLSNEDLKDLNARTKNKSGIFDNKSKYQKDEKDTTDKSEEQGQQNSNTNSRANNNTSEGRTKMHGGGYKGQKWGRREKTEDNASGSSSKTKTDNKVEIDEDILRETAREGYSKARTMYEALVEKNSSKKVNTSDSTSKTRNKTAASVKALYNSGKSVADIAKQYGISESAVYEMLEELK